MSKRSIEAILFKSNKPLNLDYFGELLSEEKSTVLRWLLELVEEYKHRGIIIRQIGQGFVMSTAEDCYDVVNKLLPTKHETLSQPTIDTIAIVGMHQPIERKKIGELRRVQNPDNGIEKALALKLIKQTDSGYVTTDKFLTYLGINDIEEYKEKINNK